jgi:hypothetical protein
MPTPDAPARDDARVGRRVPLHLHASVVLRSDDGSIRVLEVRCMKRSRWLALPISSLPGWADLKFGPFVIAVRLAG